MNIEEVEEVRELPRETRFRPFQDHRRTPKSTRIKLPRRKMNIEEVEEPETPKIHIQNPHTPIPAKSKLRKLTYKTNRQARK